MESKMPLALKVNDLDNVATVFSNEAVKGCTVEIRDKKGNSSTMQIHGDIPYGHKVALHDVHVGEDIIKYGESLGVATHEIVAGDYVHVHNLDSKRGRGDWEE